MAESSVPRSRTSIHTTILQVLSSGMAWGADTEYKIKNSLFGLQLFHASDDLNSIPIANL